MRRISPVCPKCYSQNTYDIIPGIQDLPQIQLLNEPFSVDIHQMTIGNAKYHCIECSYTWKKYRGRKPYDCIKKIDAYAGGYPGPYFRLKIDLETREVVSESTTVEYIYEPVSALLTFKDIELFRSELYKCDFVNWAEEYVAPGVLDGTHWSTRIEYDTHCEIKMGDNHFPLKWAKFCKAISKLAGSEFF
ncbi:hypothetical protein [Pseudoneobacillus rhizosphaerae]|uniref:Uncharacterized protein n=1 Tax=Pseudoneobacillus rhizosphaerae TaxID=2880968 RepID=A0A9C7LC18_9BACI|nr:hypothetical protein [Pseudoneobacillus rhizosphaerae]CAG9609150.1 hypothetical protein NEOCIP111885_02891 [Pseudoneobacillus rhizosphaerae]